MSGLEDYARTSREADSHDNNSRRKSWVPKPKLDVPAPPEGFEYRWIRMSMLGQEDANNVSYRVREGWEFVQASELPADYHMPVYEDEKSRFSGVVYSEGLLLAKMPTEMVNQRREYYEGMSQKAQSALDNNIFNDAKKDSRYVKYDSKRESGVSFGKNQG